MNLHEEALVLLGQRLHGGMLLWSLVMVYVIIHGSRFCFISSYSGLWGYTGTSIDGVICVMVI